MALINTRRIRLLKIEEMVRESKNISLGILFSKAVNEWGITEKTFWSYLEELKTSKILDFDNSVMDTEKKGKVWRNKVKIYSLDV
jgi:hypothetical protein